MPQSTLCVLTSKLVLLVNDDHYWQMLLHFRFSNQLVKGTILLIVSYHHGIVLVDALPIQEKHIARIISKLRCSSKSIYPKSPACTHKMQAGLYIILEQSIYRGFLLILPDSYHTLVTPLPKFGKVTTIAWYECYHAANTMD